MVTTTRALPLSSQSRLQHLPNTETHCYSYLSRTRTAAEIDGSEGEDNPPRVKHTRLVFLRPTCKASSACTLRCSGAAKSCGYVRGRAIGVVDYFFARTVFKNQSASLVSLQRSSTRFCPPDYGVRQSSPFWIRYYMRWPEANSYTGCICRKPALVG